MLKPLNLQFLFRFSFVLDLDFSSCLSLLTRCYAQLHILSNGTMSEGSGLDQKYPLLLVQRTQCSITKCSSCSIDPSGTALTLNRGIHNRIEDQWSLDLSLHGLVWLMLS